MQDSEKSTRKKAIVDENYKNEFLDLPRHLSSLLKSDPPDPLHRAWFDGGKLGLTYSGISGQPQLSSRL